MNIDQIIGKLMGDGSIGEEKSALEDWKKEAEDNIKALEDIKKISALSSTLNDYEDFNADNAWESFSSKIEEDKAKHVDKYSNPKKTTPIFSLSNLAKIAAVLVVVLGSVFVINSFIKPSLDSEVANSYSATTDLLNVDLDDGTNITLDKSSDIKVTNSRAVELIGRAHFDVERDETALFEIDLPVGNIVVLGTQFTVDADELSTEVYVTEGSVRFELDANRTYVLEAGDLVKVIDNEATVLKGRIDNYNSWKNQTLKFRDNNMDEVIQALSRHFKQKITIEDPKKFANCNVYDTFTNETLEEILNGLSKTHGLKFEIRNKKVFIVSAKC